MAIVSSEDSITIEGKGELTQVDDLGDGSISFCLTTEDGSSVETTLSRKEAERLGEWILVAVKRQ